MSNFKDAIFVREFALRTMYNYYALRQSVPIPKEEQSENLGKVLNRMESSGYDTSQEYEVTLGINSIIGLLVFPQQAYFSESQCATWDKLPELKKCLDAKNPRLFNYNYYYSVEEDTQNPGFTLKGEQIQGDVIKRQNNILLLKEAVTPGNILRHMRNAIAHERISIYPVSANTGEKKITHVQFKDSKGKITFLDKEYRSDFGLRIPVDRFEDIIIEIANFFIDLTAK